MARRRRSLLRRYLEVRGAVGRIRRPVIGVRTVTADGVVVRGSYLPARGGSGAVLLVHGFAANRRKPAYARLAETLQEVAPVLTIDLRGHGGSGGRSTLGDREAEDVEAAVRWLRRMGHERIVLVGASMGATAVLHATSLGAGGAEVAGVVAISAPARFRRPPETSRPLTQLHGVWASPLRRAVLWAGFGVALAGPSAWRDPPHPEEMAIAIRAPLLVVHGADDGYFPPEDADRLVAAAAGPAVVWHEPVGFGHAEDGFTPAFRRRLAAAVVELAASGRFPERAANS